MKRLIEMTVKIIKNNYREYVLSSCPKCKEGRLKSEFLDMQFDRIVYKCDRCNTRFI